MHQLASTFKVSMPVFQHQQDVFLLTKIILPAPRNGWAGLIPVGHSLTVRLRNLPSLDSANPIDMARKKSPDQTELLTRLLGVRLSEPAYSRLENLRQHTDCQTLGELGRRILSKERITFFTRDAAMDGPLEELTRIRKELNAIGNNINQITHSFHATDIANQKTFHALKVAEQYTRVGDKVDALLLIVSQLTKKWLQK